MYIQLKTCTERILIKRLESQSHSGKKLPYALVKPSPIKEEAATDTENANSQGLSLKNL